MVFFYMNSKLCTPLPVTAQKYEKVTTFCFLFFIKMELKIIQDIPEPVQETLCEMYAFLIQRNFKLIYFLLVVRNSFQNMFVRDAIFVTVH